MDINLKETYEKAIPDLDLLTMPIILVDIKSKLVVDVNKAYERAVGISKEKIVKTPCYYSNFCSEEKGYCPITDINNSSVCFNTFIINKDNLKIPILRNISKIGSNGNTYYLETIIDLKKYRDLNQLEAGEYENKFKILFDEASDAYYISKLNGVFLDGNKAAEKLTGYKKVELIGKSFLKLKMLPLNQIPKAIKLLNLNRKGMPTGPDEFVLNTKNRNKLTVEISTYPTKINGETAVLGIARDISKHIELEGKIQNLNKVLEEKVQVRSDEINRMNLKLRQELVNIKNTTAQKDYERDKYLNLFNDAPEGIIIVNRLGIVTQCNHTVYKFTGYNPKDLIGKRFAKISAVFPKDIPRFLKIFSRVLTGEKNIKFEIYLRRKSRESFYAEVHIGKLKEKNKIIGFQIMIRDITQKAMAEKALSESEKRFQLLSEATSEGIIIHNKGKIIDANKRLVEIFGDTREEGLKKTVFNFLDKSSYALVIKNMLTNYDKPYQALGVKKDGTRFPIMVCAKVIPFDGKFMHVATISDISGEVKTKRALSDSESRFKLLSEATSEGIIIHENGKIIDGNDKLGEMIGISREEGIGQSLLNFLDPHSRVIVVKNILIQNRKNYELIAIRKDGTKFPIEICSRTIPFEGRKVRVASVRDISTYKEAEKIIKQSEQKFRDLTEFLPETVFECDINGKIIYVNRTGLVLFGYSKKEINKGISIFKIVDEKDHIKLKNNIENLIRNKNSGSKEYVGVKKNGERLLIDVHGNLITNEKGEPVGVRGILIDITERRKAEKKIKLLSFHDYLTGVYNRAFFEEELHRLDTERQLPLTLVIGDINGLKIINDTFGHGKGDELLIKVAQILKESFRAEDIVARWGGDEFTVILPKINLKDTLKIIDRINYKLKVESTKILPLSVAFGLATKEDSSQKIDELIKTAEDKMYRHKMMEQQSAHSAIISSLGKALEERDYETSEHVKRMKDLAIGLGEELKLSEETLDEISLLAALHDIGKISIADSIILKPRSLTQEEWQIVKRHPEVGYRIAESSPELFPIAKGILYHHEWWNGKGYPKGLAGKKIPLISRIISIVDAYDAMTNDRPYRKALSTEEAISEIERCAGSQFDPNLAAKFIGIIEKATNNTSVK